MKRLMLFLLLMSSAFAFGKAEVFEKSTFNELDEKTPRDVCRRINSDSLQLECLQIIRYYSYTQPALEFCDQLKTATATNSCMRDLGDKVIQFRSVRVCSKITEDYQALSCAQAAANKSYNEVSTGFCDQLKGAIGTIDCMRVLANVRFIQPNAAKACSRITADNLAVQCVSVIKNRRYSDYEVEDCDRMRTAEATIQCFRY